MTATMMEPIGTIGTWQANRGTDLDESTPLVSGIGWTFEEIDTTPILTNPRFLYRESSALHTRVWMPWAFEPALGPHRVTVSSLGLGAIASGIVLVASGATALMSTELFPAPGVLGLINPGQIVVDTTPLWQEVTELRLVTPGLRPRTLRLAEMPSALLGPRPQRTHQRTIEVREALTDLMRWLHRNRDEVARLCQFSLRASRYWDTGKTPRPGTVRRLFEVHSFVGSLVSALGTQRARTWLDQTGSSGAPRRDELGTDDGLTRLLRESNRLLFRAAPLPKLAGPESAEAEIAAEAAAPYEPRASRPQPRRPRRPPPSGV
jgi:hypothetical protein